MRDLNDLLTIADRLGNYIDNGKHYAILGFFIFRLKAIREELFEWIKMGIRIYRLFVPENYTMSSYFQVQLNSFVQSQMYNFKCNHSAEIGSFVLFEVNNNKYRVNCSNLFLNYNQKIKNKDLNNTVLPEKDSDYVIINEESNDDLAIIIKEFFNFKKSMLITIHSDRDSYWFIVIELNGDISNDVINHLKSFPIIVNNFIVNY